MRHLHLLLNRKTVLLMLLMFTVSFVAFGQSSEANNQEKAKKEKKARSSFKIYAGATLNDLDLDSSNPIESSTAVGYNLGLSYKRGRLFYYEIGGRFNKRIFDVEDKSGTATGETFSVSSLEVPITGGINITSYIDRLVGVRAFVSAIPSFTIGEDVDDVTINSDDVSSFMFYGQAGVGIDITVIFIETGFNFGFDDIVDANIKSIPSQFFINLGFRF